MKSLRFMPVPPEKLFSGDGVILTAPRTAVKAQSGGTREGTIYDLRIMNAADRRPVLHS
jgi:hypothetical protein